MYLGLGNNSETDYPIPLLFYQTYRIALERYGIFVPNFMKGNGNNQ